MVRKSFIVCVLTLLILLAMGCTQDGGECDGPQPDPCQDKFIGTAHLIDSTAEWLPDSIHHELVLFDSIGTIMEFATNGLSKSMDRVVLKSYNASRCGGYNKTCKNLADAESHKVEYSNGMGAIIDRMVISREKKFTYPLDDSKSYLNSLNDMIHVRFVFGNNVDLILDYELKNETKFYASISLLGITFNDVFELPGEGRVPGWFLYYSYEKGVIGFRQNTGKLWAIK
ncbi:MAG: hypothetical protein V4590_01805 [Bacteroidota bacterium]